MPCSALLTVADKAQYTIVFALFGGKSTTKVANKKKKTLINYNSLRTELFCEGQKGWVEHKMYRFFRTVKKCPVRKIFLLS